MITCRSNTLYLPGQTVRSLVHHSPPVQVGTVGRIVNRWAGTVFAVEKSDGELHRWFDLFELQSLDPNDPRLREGSSVLIASNKEHYNIQNGDIVRIVKMIDTDYYEIDLGDRSFRHWLAGFELSSIL